MKKWKLWVIAAAVTVIVAIAIIAVVGMDRNGIVDQYYALSNKPENSARQFRVPFGYITVNSDGTINIEFATSIKTISTDIDVADNDYNGATPDDETQNGGSGNGSGESDNRNPQPAKPPNPINGDTLIFPKMGESLWYREINTGNTGIRKRVGPDVVSWEFSWGYISTTSSSEFQKMKRRANKIAPYVQNGSSNDALRVNLGGESYYVGCLPINGFGTLGDIVEFSFDNGSKIKVLAIDAKSENDELGTGSYNQCNTQYCHGILSGNDIKLSAVELWCGGNNTGDGNRSSWPTGNVVQAKIIGHSDVFD